VFYTLVMQAVAILTTQHLHVPGPEQYGQGPPCLDNPLHQLCVGPGPAPAGRWSPPGVTWESKVLLALFIVATVLIVSRWVLIRRQERG
jgi:hypothetical protein